MVTGIIVGLQTMDGVQYQGPTQIRGALQDPTRLHGASHQGLTLLHGAQTLARILSLLPAPALGKKGVIYTMIR